MNRKDLENYVTHWLTTNGKHPNEVQYIHVPVGAAVRLLEHANARSAWQELCTCPPGLDPECPIHGGQSGV